jgi:hypothetical protein
MNKILTQKWFLFQNIKDSSYFRNGVFNKGEWTYSAVAHLTEFWQKYLPCIPEVCQHRLKISKPSLI